MMKINIVSKEFIKPSSPTPPNLQQFNLSYIDGMIPPSFFPLILYYSVNEGKNIIQSKMTNLLKNSLSDALVKFYPLAGRMKGQTSVDCNDQGILYVEAHVDGKISSLRECTKTDFLDELVPYKFNGSISSSEEQLAIQVSLFECGGISIGICISHRIADGFTLSSFIKFWSDVCLGDEIMNLMSPVFDSASLFPPRNTPDFRPNFRSLSVLPPVTKFVTKRFVFNESAIDALKLKVIHNSSVLKPTRVEVLSAFLWHHCMMASGGKRVLKKPSKSVVFFPINLRRRIPSILSDFSFGNLFQMTSAVSSVGEGDWIQLVEKLRDAFKKIDGEYINKLLGGKGSDLCKQNFMEISKFLGLEDFEVFRFSSYCRFPFYEADFGWGKPFWVSCGSVCNKNIINLFDSVNPAGGIEAWIVMAHQEMERLEKNMNFQGYISS